MADKKLVARLVKGDKEVARLHVGTGWECGDEMTKLYLNLHFDPERETGAGVVLPYGHYSAALAAKKLGCGVVYAKEPVSLPPGVIS